MQNKIFLTRTRHRINQYVIAQRSGISQTRISLIENSLVTPRADEKERIARALLAKVEEIFPEGVGNEPGE
jgi:transcriptional regulator with XRE-family HTH domain